MQITIDDNLLRGTHLTPVEAKLNFAVGLFSERRVTLGRAASIAELSQIDFLRELGKRRIPIHYDLEDLEADLKTIEIFESSDRSK